jgi:membrane-associated protease RseP (regulator of RpoE activity)
MTFTLGLLAGLFLIVFVHELGHYLVARYFGVPISCISIGFGPVLYEYEPKEGPVYRLALLPLGGFVRVLGQTYKEVEDKVDKAKKKIGKQGLVGPYTQKEVRAMERLLNALPLDYHLSDPKTRAVLVAGATFNILLIPILTMIAVFPDLISKYDVNPRISVTDGTLAYEAGLRTKDYIMKVNDEFVYVWEDLFVAIRDLQDENGVVPAEVTLSVYREPGRPLIEIPFSSSHLDFTDYHTVIESFKSSGLYAYKYEGLEYSLGVLYQGLVTAPIGVLKETIEPLTGILMRELYFDQAFPELSPNDYVGRTISSRGHKKQTEETHSIATSEMLLETTEMYVDHKGRPVTPPPFFLFLVATAVMSVLIGLLNLLPIPPLDGGLIALSFATETGVLNAESPLVGKSLRIILFAIVVVSIPLFFREIGYLSGYVG